MWKNIVKEDLRDLRDYHTAQKMKFNLRDYHTAQKMKFPIKNFFSKQDQIRRKLRIWSHLLKKSLTENFIFCAVSLVSDFPICFKMGFPSSESSFHFDVLVSIDFLINSKGDALFHRKISDNFPAN